MREKNSSRRAVNCSLLQCNKIGIVPQNYTAQQLISGRKVNSSIINPELASRAELSWISSSSYKHVVVVKVNSSASTPSCSCAFTTAPPPTYVHWNGPKMQWGSWATLCAATSKSSYVSFLMQTWNQLSFHASLRRIQFIISQSSSLSFLHVRAFAGSSISVKQAVGYFFSNSECVLACVFAIRWNVSVFISNVVDYATTTSRTRLSWSGELIFGSRRTRIRSALIICPYSNTPIQLYIKLKPQANQDELYSRE